MIVFTKHARQRMTKRYITTQDVIETLKNGSVTRRKGETQNVTYGIFEVVIQVKNDTIIIVTVMPARNKKKYIEKYAKKHHIGYHQALKILNQKFREEVAA